MKNISLGLIALLIVLGTGCKKEYNYIDGKPDVGTETHVKLLTGENTNVSVEYIRAHKFTIVGAWAFNKNDTRIWKLKSENNVVIINPVPADMFWQPQWAQGKILDSGLILELTGR